MDITTKREDWTPFGPVTVTYTRTQIAFEGSDAAVEWASTLTRRILDRMCIDFKEWTPTADFKPAAPFPLTER
jgi:hypothetical protein